MRGDSPQYACLRHVSTIQGSIRIFLLREKKKKNNNKKTKNKKNIRMNTRKMSGKI